MEEELYKQNILDHYKNPHNKGVPASFDLEQVGINPSCGDSLTLYLSFDDTGCISTLSFAGEGCAISQAAASMLTEKVRGMRINEARLLTPGDVYTMLGITISPGRTKCALLAYKALTQALENYSKKNT